MCPSSSTPCYPLWLKACNLISNSFIHSMTVPFHKKLQGNSYTAPSISGELGSISSSPGMASDGQQLVLDLDHTLISSFEFGESPSQRRGVSTVCPILIEEYKDEYGLPEMYHATISNVVVLIKLRPHVRRFIKEASEQGLVLNVYTKGRRSYMNEVVRLIDPEGCIKGKLISRDDEPSYMRDNQKDPSLIDGGSKRPFVVLDDSPVVWSSCAGYAEIIAAKRYCFSDSFVTFLKSMERTSIKMYPRDGDAYLAQVLSEHIKPSLDRLSIESPLFTPMCGPRTVTMSTTHEEYDDEFSPISDWEKPSNRTAKPVVVLLKDEEPAVTMKIAQF